MGCAGALTKVLLNRNYPNSDSNYGQNGFRNERVIDEKVLRREIMSRRYQGKHQGGRRLLTDLFKGSS